MSEPATRHPKAVDSQGRWLVAAVAGTLVILLLLGANVQLWRVADRAGDGSGDSAATAEIPPLPKTDERGSRSLLRNLDASERALDESLSGLESAIAGAGGGASSANALAGRLDTLSKSLQEADDGAPQMARVADELAVLSGDLRRLDPVKKDISGLNAKAGKASDSANLMLATSNALSVNMDSLGGRVDTLTGEMDGLQNRLIRLAGGIDRLDGQLTALGGGANDLETLLGQLLPLMVRSVDGLEIISDFLCAQGTPTPPSCPPQPPAEP